MPKPSTPNRRSFLTATAAAVFAPTIIPSRAFGANDRVVLGHIGVGGQGTSNLNAFLKKKDAAPAVLCDVDKDHLNLALGVARLRGASCDGESDYRRVLDRKDVDALVVSTPDHWHALPTVQACEAGKDVYCEKPLSLTIAEGRAMVEAARKNSRVVQTGSQQRSSEEFRRACQMVRNGDLGTIKTVLVGIENVNFAGPPVPDSAPPNALDYDTWLGPAPSRPYNTKRVHYNFRFFWDYSGGQMTNWGAHHIDIAQWGLGTDDTGPVSSEGTATFHPEHWYEVTRTCRITHTYANGVTLVVGQGQKDIPSGVTFVGSASTLFVNRGKLKVEEGLHTGATTEAVALERSDDHHQNFLDCVRSREKPICDVEIGHRSATICHLGNIVARLGRKIAWDPAAQKIVGDDEANAMLSRPYRAPWNL